MPIYEYQCQACGKQLEKIQKFNDAPLIDCPVCGAPQLKKLISAAGFQLKGSGWYVTDFRDKGKPSGPAAEKTSTTAEKVTPSASATSDTVKPVINNPPAGAS